MPLMKLTWNTHYSSIFSLLSSFLNNETLVDITLAAEGQFLKAHRIILCACSQFFQELITSLDKDKQPVIFLQGVQFTQLQALMKFIYCGEIQVASEELPALLTIAEELKIRGILDYHSDEDEGHGQATTVTGAGTSGRVSNHYDTFSASAPPASSTPSAESEINTTAVGVAVASSSSSKKLPISILPKQTQGQFSNPAMPARFSRRPLLMLKRPRIGPKSKVQQTQRREPEQQQPTATLEHLNSSELEPELPEEVEQYMTDMAAAAIEDGQVKIEMGDEMQMINEDFGEIGDEDDDHRFGHGVRGWSAEVDEYQEQASSSRTSLTNTNSDAGHAGSAGANDNGSQSHQKRAGAVQGSSSVSANARLRPATASRPVGVTVTGSPSSLSSLRCGTCGRVYTSSKSLWRHRKFSFCGQDVREVFCCTECGKRFSRSDNLRRHALISHNTSS